MHNDSKFRGICQRQPDGIKNVLYRRLLRSSAQLNPRSTVARQVRQKLPLSLGLVIKLSFFLRSEDSIKWDTR